MCNEKCKSKLNVNFFVKHHITGLKETKYFFDMTESILDFITVMTVSIPGMPGYRWI